MSPETRRRRMRWMVPLLVILLAGAWWSLGAVTGEDTPWAGVERDDLVLGVEVTGKLQSVETDLIGPPQLAEMWQFKIARLAPEGEEVKAGTPVVTFDSSELQQRLQREVAERDSARKEIDKAEEQRRLRKRQDEMGLAEARARLRKAQLKVDLPDELLRTKELSEARLDLELAQREVAYLEERLSSVRRSGEATLGALRALLAGAEKRVARTESDIAQMTRSAPRDGTVIYVTNWRDEKKKVGDACWRGESVIELPDLSSMKGSAQVHEADAGKVREGQKVRFRLDAHPDLEINGHVELIWRTVQRESHSSKLKVVRLDLALDETDTRRMRPGMRFRGEVETERVAEALLVPADAIFLKTEGPVVYRRTWLGHETVPVELGRRNGDRVEVLDGLSEGDRVSRTDLERKERGA